MWRYEGTSIALRVFWGKMRLIFLHKFLRRKLIKHHISALGLPMYIDLSEPGLSRTLFYRGIHEPLATRLVQEELAPGMVIIDIGANLGYYVLLEAKTVGENGVIYAIEPVPSSYSILQKNVALNHCTQVHTFRLALGDKDGTATMYITDKLNWSHIASDLLDSKRAIHIRSAIQRSVQVPIMRLDSFVHIYQIEQVHFLRMDVEGFEIAVIRGAYNTIAREVSKHIFKIFMEVHPFLTSDRTPFLNMVQKLYELGLKVKYIGYRDKIIAENPPLREVQDYLFKEEFVEAPHLLFSNG